MRRKWLTILGGIVLSSCLLCGCSKPAVPDQGEKNVAKNIELIVDKQNSGREESLNSGEVTDENESPSDVMAQKEELRKVTYYYVNMETADIESATAEIRNEAELWNLLKEKGILSKECALNHVKVNTKEKKMELDFNKGCGDWIRGMGTTGETEVIGCIVNSFLDAFQCDLVLLTEDGAEFMTSSGANFSGYTERIDF